MKAQNNPGIKFFILLVFTSISFIQCNNDPKIESTLNIEEFFYSEKTDKMPENLEKKIGSWAKVGTQCYGILFLNTDSIKLVGYPIPCKIISYHDKGIKCRVTKNYYPYKEFGCSKIGLRKGEVWLEMEGDLFKTEAEAIDYLKSMNAYK